jgi:hypothetical protein
MKNSTTTKTPLFLLPPVPSIRCSAFCFRHAAPTIFENLSACAGSHGFCDAIHSEDTNLFQIMKNPISEAPKYRNTAPFGRRTGISSPTFGFRTSNCGCPLGLRISQHLLSPNFFLKGCADSHSFCGPIHSEDMHLFRIIRIMKKPTAQAPKYRKTALFRLLLLISHFGHGPLVFWSFGRMVPGP